MKQKRLLGGNFVLLLLLLTITMVSVVSAQTYYYGSNSFIQGFERVFQGIIDFLSAILTPFFGFSSIAGLTTGEVLFIKILFFSVVLAIIWSVVDAIALFGDNTWARVLVSIATSILATRILASPGWIETLMLPYSVLGIAIASLIPLLILFYFFEMTSCQRIFRKIGWIFVGVVFLSLYFMRADEIGAAAGGNFNPAWIYLITTFACLAFFLFDGTIQSALRRAEVGRIHDLSHAHGIAAVNREARRLEADIRAGGYNFNPAGRITGTHYRTIYNNLAGQAAALGIALPPTLPHPA
ncbi:MAG: hypothetical protein AABW73_04900 [Nanoarchaeota archaeon]